MALVILSGQHYEQPNTIVAEAREGNVERTIEGETTYGPELLLEAFLACSQHFDGRKPLQRRRRLIMTRDFTAQFIAALVVAGAKADREFAGEVQGVVALAMKNAGLAA